jgi:hypothetical protein
MSKAIKLMFFSLPVYLFFFHSLHAQDPYTITMEMFEQTKQVSTVTYEMKKLERIDGEIIEQRSLIKLSRDPFKVYVKQLYPKEGIEVLYKKGANNNMVLVNPNGFPWFNINLDPLGKTIRNNQHHTIMEAGFDHVVNILQFLFNKYDNEIRGMITLVEKTEWQGRPCWVMKLENPYFTFIPYTVDEGENLDSIARKFMISQHMIMERNEDIDDFNDVYPGQEILIPNDYSPEMVLYIDAELKVPVLMKIYDHEGLYEYYEYSNVNINPAIHPEEFSARYADYGF